MIHLAAKHILDEMMSLQQLARVCVSRVSADSTEPTLVIKTKSLLLKYLLKSPHVQFVFGQLDNGSLMYGVLVDDDSQSPLGLWSLVEREDELQALIRIIKGERFMLAMFNEAVANICSGLVKLRGGAHELANVRRAVNLASPGDFETAEAEVTTLLESWHANGTGLRVLTSDGVHEWGPNKCLYITTQLQTSELDLLHSDEGRQQEEIAAWITDSLQPSGVFQNPTAQEGTPRELCDLLLTHAFSTILFESKALSILSAQALPKRTKLRNLVAKHIEKALRQLSGASRNLKSGVRITDTDGVEINVERGQPPHCVVIIPDLTLLNGIEPTILKDIAEFGKKTGAFLNILDPSQLFSMMMDSNNVSHRQQNITPLMAFDYLLLRRFKSTLDSNDPGVITLCRFEAIA
jgi:hypothetical protein